MANKWSPAARARHLAGVKRYQHERRRREFARTLFDDLQDFAGRHGYDLEKTVNAFFDTARMLIKER